MPTRRPTDTGAHYQFRLVKQIRGSRIVTHQVIAHSKSPIARDKSLDIFEADSDIAALQRARSYIRRSGGNKGPLPGEFRGVVVVRYATDPAKPGLIGARNKWGQVEVTNRRRRLQGTTTWLYYIDPTGQAYSLGPNTHRIERQVGGDRAD